MFNNKKIKDVLDLYFDAVWMSSVRGEEVIRPDYNQAIIRSVSESWGLVVVDVNDRGLPRTGTYLIRDRELRAKVKAALLTAQGKTLNESAEVTL